MQTTKKSPGAVYRRKGRLVATNTGKLSVSDTGKKLVASSSNLPARIIAEPAVVVQPVGRKAGIRRNRNNHPLNPNRRKMTVNVAESFVEIQEMNDKALKILAKRA